MRKKRPIYFEWDIDTWSRSLELWNNVLPKYFNGKALDLGSRRGGLSLFLAKEFNMDVICSDLVNPMVTAEPEHRSFNLCSKIEYDSVDCTNIPYPAATFDIIIFKSVVGALGTKDKQTKAFDEIYRVLKPGGALLFAENAKATYIHMFLRRKIIKWGDKWRYISEDDMKFFTKDFKDVHYRTTGFLNVFLPESRFKIFFSKVDKVFDYIVPSNYRYVIYGYVIK